MSEKRRFSGGPRALLLAAAILSLGGNPALAQDYPNAVKSYGSYFFSRVTPLPTPLRSPADLRISYKPEVTAEFAKLMSGVKAPNALPPEQMSALYKSGELRRIFNVGLGSHGLSDQDLADVMAGHFVINWEIVNAWQGEDRTPTAGVRALRDDLRAALSASPWVAALRPEDKQLFAEMIINNTMMILMRYIGALKSNNLPSLTLAASDARQGVLKYAGIDLTMFRFTEKGLEPF